MMKPTKVSSPLRWELFVELYKFQAMGALLIWSLKLVVDPRLRPGEWVGSHGGKVMGGKGGPLVWGFLNLDFMIFVFFVGDFFYEWYDTMG